jgi:hypothetical protein
MRVKKGKASKAAKIYLRKAQKHWRKHGSPTPSQQTEAEEKIDRMIADLKAKAAEVPRLKAEAQRLEERIEKIYLDIATLAALISPAAFAGSPDDRRAAIKLAFKRLRDTKRIVGEIIEEGKEKEKKALAEAEKADLAKIRHGYERAVKLITGELKQPDRARDKWKRYVAAKKVTPGSDLEKVLAHYRERWERHGWTLPELVGEKREFADWWKQEKSNQAKKAAGRKHGGQAKAKTGKKRGRGRVKRPASDLRKKEVRLHKLGYCRVCGIKIAKNQRVCDGHIKAKVMAFSVGSTDLANFQEEQGIVGRY